VKYNGLAANNQVANILFMQKQQEIKDIPGKRIGGQVLFRHVRIALGGPNTLCCKTLATLILC
jgi:hypothetical protein